MGTLPLEIKLIRDKILLYLDWNELKICRQVCPKWEEILREDFVKKATVFINNEKQGEKDLEEFLKVFPKDSIVWQLSLFSKFNLTGEFMKDNVQAFIDSQENILQVIKFHQFSTVPNSWIWNWNATNLTHFEVRYGYKTAQGKGDMEIALSNFRTTKTIILFCDQNQKINIILDEKISPAILWINGADFWTKDRVRSTGFALNEFFDIKNLVDLDFWGKENVTVDLSESYNMKKCSFHTGRITGWNRDLQGLIRLSVYADLVDQMSIPTCVKDFCIGFCYPGGTIDLTHFLQLKTMYIEGGDAVGWHQNLTLKKLTFNETPGQVNLSLLPKSLENLKIFNFDVICSSPSTTSFPNMKKLSYSDEHEIHMYSFCPSLTELCLCRCKLFPQSLPNTVKVIHFNGPVKIRGITAAGVDTVTVSQFLDDPFEWQLIDAILKKLNPRVIKVDPIFGKTTNEIISENILHRIHKSVKKQMNDPSKIFFINALRWIKSEALSAEEIEKIFQQTPLPAGMMKSSYQFKNGRELPVAHQNLDVMY